MNPEPEISTITAALREAVSESPDRIFLDFRGTKLTFRQFDVLSNRYAHGLAEIGLERGQPLALMLDNSLEAVLLWFAANKLGAISAPVNTAFKGSYLAGQLADCGARIFIGEDDYTERLAHLRAEVPQLRHVIARSELDTLLSATTDSPTDENRPGDPAVLIYTSGTTGASKGCVICHNHVFTMGWSSLHHRGIGEDSVLWTCLPYFHMFAIGMHAMAGIVARCTAAFTERFSVSDFWPEVERTGATDILFLGSMAQLLANAPDDPAASRSFAKIRQLHVAPFPIDLALVWEQRFGVPARPATGYGMTEAVISSQLPDDSPAPTGSAGRTGVFFDIAIVDDDDQQVAPGVIGEIVCRPRYPHIMFKGYWRNPDATINAWQNLWFHTGDLGRMDESGYLYFVDRKKDYLRRRGENISSLELEALLRRHPAIRDVAVHAVPSPLGEDEVKVTVELKEPGLIDEASLCAWCVSEVPYFAVPLYIEFRDELPRTATGKIQKNVLRDEGRTPTTWSREAAGFKFERR